MVCKTICDIGVRQPLFYFKRLDHLLKPNNDKEGEASHYVGGKIDICRGYCSNLLNVVGLRTRFLHIPAADTEFSRI